MGNHITKTGSVSFYYLCNIRRSRQYLSNECKEHWYMPLFLVVLAITIAYYMGYRHVSYRNCRVQNSAAHLVFEESKFCHITPPLRSLHWLPVKHRIGFKVLLLTLKVIYVLTPPYIPQLISVKDTSGNFSLRSNNSILLNFPTSKSVTMLGDWSFYMAAPKLWSAVTKMIFFIQSTFCLTAHFFFYFIL